MALSVIEVVHINDNFITELIQASREKNTSNPYEIRGFEVFLHCGKVA